MPEAVVAASLFQWADLGRDFVALVIEALDGLLGAPLEVLRVGESGQPVPQFLRPNRQLDHILLR